jgi:hypothetical protein
MTIEESDTRVRDFVGYFLEDSIQKAAISFAGFDQRITRGSYDTSDERTGDSAAYDRRDLLLWLLRIPIPAIILLYVFLVI